MADRGELCEMPLKIGNGFVSVVDSHSERTVSYEGFYRVNDLRSNLPEFKLVKNYVNSDAIKSFCEIIP